MEIFGIGPTELILIVLLALIILGPKDMQKAGRTIGRWLRNLVTSDGWRAFLNTSREIRNLPTRLMREANLEDLQQLNQDVGKIGTDLKETVDKNLRQPRFGAWGNAMTPPRSKPEPAEASPGPSPAPVSPPPPQPASPSEAGDHA